MSRSTIATIARFLPVWATFLFAGAAILIAASDPVQDVVNPIPDTALSRHHLQQAIPSRPPTPKRTLTTDGDGDGAKTYRSAPNRPADMTARLTCYQPNARTNRPHRDPATGGGPYDARGNPLRWGVVGANQNLWRYGQRIYLGEPFWQVFEIRDSFGAPKPRSRMDLCCWTAQQYDCWTRYTQRDNESRGRRDNCLQVECWVLRDDEK